jgi:putative hydrolase of the HAD superfamily
VCQDFQAIVYTEELGREFWKPSPRGLEKLMELLQAQPAQTVYVGDNEKKDFIAPNHFGLTTVQILRPARLHTKTCPLPGATAQQKIRQISELAAILRRL